MYPHVKSKASDAPPPRPRHIGGVYDVDVQEDSPKISQDEGASYWRLIDQAQELIPTVIDDVDMEASRLVMSLNRAMRVVIYDLEIQTLKGLGQSDSTFRLLFALWVAGPLSPHAVASLAGMSRPTVSSLISALRKEGLIDRRDDPSDGRSALLSLTDLGTQTIMRAFTDHNLREKEWASLLTPIERQVLTMLLKKLMDGRGSIGAVERR